MIKIFFIFLVLLIAWPGNIKTAASQYLQTDNFTFVRIKYSSGQQAYGFRLRYNTDSWAVDYPTAEENFLRGLRTATQLPVADQALALPFTDSQIFSYPFAYMLEVGYLQFTQEEADTLREWCLRGGFLMIDDFHGTVEWRNFIAEFSKAFPNFQPVQLPSDHPIFHCYYDFAQYPRVPGLGPLSMGRLYERDGYNPECWGVFDDKNRLMILINHNVDLGDSWEHAADPRYPPFYSKLGYMLGINYIVYALTH
ncbi:MAG: DUF4159 domain-containing protein [candidate division KSB1 bacterium]|nr:DUF4159 domain-containing protein [candidate division KSB1 bacterium]